MKKFSDLTEKEKQRFSIEVLNAFNPKLEKNQGGWYGTETSFWRYMNPEDLKFGDVLLVVDYGPDKENKSSFWRFWRTEYIAGLPKELKDQGILDHDPKGHIRGQVFKSDLKSHIEPQDPRAGKTYVEYRYMKDGWLEVFENGVKIEAMTLAEKMNQRILAKF